MRRQATRFAVALAIAPVLLAAGATPPAPMLRGDGPTTAEVLRPAVDEVGLASWYGEWHHGRLTASGEPFDMHRLTAAHLTLEFGTRVAVLDVETGRQVEVTITDRGPYVSGRIIDLSYAAARRLGAVARGVVPVRLRIVAPAAAAVPPARADG